MNPFNVSPQGETVERLKYLIRDGMTIRVAEKSHPPRLYTVVGAADGVAGAPRKLVVREMPLWPGDPAELKLKDWDEVLGVLFPVDDQEGTPEKPAVKADSVRIGTIATSWNEGGYEITANTTASSFPRQLSLRAVRDNEDYHYVQALRPANPDGGLGE